MFAMFGSSRVSVKFLVHVSRVNNVSWKDSFGQVAVFYRLVAYAVTRLASFISHHLMRYFLKLFIFRATEPHSGVCFCFSSAINSLWLVIWFVEKPTNFCWIYSVGLIGKKRPYKHYLYSYEIFINKWEHFA